MSESAGPTPPTDAYPVEGLSHETHLLGPRKRIVAREVQSASLTTLRPTELALLGSEMEVAPPRLRVRPEPLVLDPTAQIGERHRKHSHKWGYRFTALTSVLAFVLASGAISVLLMDHLNIARLLAVAAVLLAVASLRLAHTSKLAARLRGYAIAASVLAAVALAANLAGNFIHDALTEAKVGVQRPPR